MFSNAYLALLDLQGPLGQLQFAGILLPIPADVILVGDYRLAAGAEFPELAEDQALFGFSERLRVLLTVS